MTLSQRLRLNGRVDTQALLGESVVVVSVARGWAHVVIPDQPTPSNRRGYAGWIPVRQLVAGRYGAGPSVVVTKRTTWLRRTSGSRSLEVSFGTRLSALRRSGGYWQVRLPTGAQALVSATDVTRGTLQATPSSVTMVARRFLGLAYLWAGLSGFGFDCSGLTHLVYRVHGVRIPRDADAQAVAGRPVTRRQLRPGDLVFFAAAGSVHHVGMYVGRGRMLHAPRTGSMIRVTSLSVAPWASEYAGARRYLR
jgi:cell wall-associated NlpC family hydrolase